MPGGLYRGPLQASETAGETQGVHGPELACGAKHELLTRPMDFDCCRKRWLPCHTQSSA